MSAIQENKLVWPSLPKEKSCSKYEKCRNITEEIYKRIDITFQIKKLRTASQSESEHSDQIEIDSNELSNDTDMFACERSDSIASSISELEPRKCNIINMNNNVIKRSVVPIYKPPRKKFRKKIKKRHTKEKVAETEYSSDEALPLSKIVVEPHHYGEDSVESAEVMGVPKITILSVGDHCCIKETTPKPMVPPKPRTLTATITKKSASPKPRTVEKKTESTVDVKSVSPKLSTNEKKSESIGAIKSASPIISTVEDKPSKVEEEKSISTVAVKVDSPKCINESTDENKSSNANESVKVSKTIVEKSDGDIWKKCSMCNLTCRGDRGLRRHMSLSHILIPEDITRPKIRKDTR